MSTDTPYEIERKYLIKCPDPAILKRKHKLSVVEIRQTYLMSGPEGENRRIRSWRESGKTRYFYTEKAKVTNVTRIEREREISKQEALLLLAEADPKCRTIEKTRYRFTENGLTYEIDIFPFWKKQAYMEVEIPDEDTRIPFPKDLTLLREVTEDQEYTNHALAKRIPEEDEITC